MRNELRRDFARYAELKEDKKPWRAVCEGLLFDSGLQAVVLHRLAHAIRKAGVPFLGPLIGRFSQVFTGVEIAPGTQIGPGLLISHGNGIVIGQWSRLGRDCTLMHQVNLGAPSLGRRKTMPVVGDRVFIGAGARLIGGITVGDDVFIGVNAIIAEDIPSGCKVVSGAGIKILPPRDTPTSDATS
ncbi:MAG: serine O-acetyltransferase [Acidobacteriota bacterium]